MKVPIEISSHHIHLCRKDLEILFGKDYQLKVLKNLSQPNQFAAEETVVLINAKYKLEKVRILGPVREKTQIEISKTDAINFGLETPIKESGDLKESVGGLDIVGPHRKIELGKGIIIALRHIHTSPTDAVKYKLQDKQLVSVKIEGERGLIFHNVMVKIDPDFIWSMHIDTDEANAAGLKGGEEGEVIIEIKNKK